MRARQSIPASASADRLRLVAAPRAARSARAGAEKRGAERHYFVRRCLHTWAAAGQNMRSFFQRWTPLPVGVVPLLPSPGRTARRGATARRGIAARRIGRRPAPGGRAARAVIPAPDAAKAAALRRRFPYVAELLGELAAMDCGERTRSAGNRR